MRLARTGPAAWAARQKAYVAFYNYRGKVRDGHFSLDGYKYPPFQAAAPMLDAVVAADAEGEAPPRPRIGRRASITIVRRDQQRDLENAAGAADASRVATWHGTLALPEEVVTRARTRRASLAVWRAEHLRRFPATRVLSRTPLSSAQWSGIGQVATAALFPLRRSTRLLGPHMPSVGRCLRMPERAHRTHIGA